MDRYQFFKLTSLLICCVFLFPFLVFGKKKGGGGAVGTVFAHAMLLVVLPTFQLVTKLTKEKNKT